MPISRRRLILLMVFLTAWGGAVVYRLHQIQIQRHESYVRRALNQQERTVTLAPLRGSVYDRAGRVLAESVVSDSFYADPQALTDPAVTAAALAKVDGIAASAEELERRFRRQGEFAWIVRQASPALSAEIRSLGLEGVYSLEEHKRSYPKNRLASNILGYVSVDGEGLAGIEHSFDQYARGRAGKVTLLRDARRGSYLVGGEGINAAVDGHHVVLTIDEVIQFLAEKALQAAVERHHAVAGSVVVLDPHSGAVLALASVPNFDPNRFGTYPPSAWRNRPVQDLYEPGSTFKIVTAAAAIEEGLVTPTQIIDCGMGGIEIGRVRIRENAGKRFGLMSFESVLAHSSNVGTIRVGLSLGQQRLYDYVRLFGFGEKCGIELPGEGEGLVRPVAKWSSLSNAVISMGQEIGVTPLQIAQATAVIASGGIRYPVHIVDRVVDSEGNTVYRPEREEPRRIISERTAAVVNEMLKVAVSQGTGKNAALSDYAVAGKTGTAQKAVRGGYSREKFVASFAGYVPADRPRLVILAVIDEPRGTHYGGAVAAPVFRELAEGALRYLEVDPSLPVRELPLEGIRLATFSQSPPSGAATVAADPQSADQIPDLRGLDSREAVARAIRAGYEVSSTGSGFVAEQTPSPGSSGGAERHIRLKLKPRWEPAT
jgi:cell division protein FtsI (penicillin-binding protein 3)